MKHSRGIKMSIKLTLFIFIILMISTAAVGSLGMLLYHYNFFGVSYLAPIYLLMASLSISAFIGTLLSIIFSRHSVKTIDRLIKGLSEIGHGNFNVQLPRDDKRDDVVDNFNKMAQELASIEVMRNNFVANFSHEFKTPIASIQGFAKLLRDKNISDSDRQEYLGIIIDESARLSVLANNTLIMSKLEAQELISGKTNFQLDEQIRQSILLLESTWQAKDISLDINLPSIKMTNNSNLIEQIWINVIGNAIKFSDIGGSIAISATTAIGNCIVTISDNGIGMDENTLVHLFDKYYQGDFSRSTQGNGLGLSIVHRIIDLCGGSIRVKSKLDGGSTFIISLPLNIDDSLPTNG